MRVVIPYNNGNTSKIATKIIILSLLLAITLFRGIYTGMKTESLEETTMAAERANEKACAEIMTTNVSRAIRSKIARLPAKVREELNSPLADGEDAAGIVMWVNGLPAVQAILSKRFQGQPINEDNISRWRHSGFAAWQENARTRETIEGLGAACAGFNDGTQDELCERLTLILTARLTTEVKKFDGMPEGEEKAATWKGLVLLRRGDFYAGKLRLERNKLELSPAAQEAAARERRRNMDPEEQRLRIQQVLGTGKYRVEWDNVKKRMIGPGAPAYYEEEAIKTRLRKEIEERKKAGTWPSDGFGATL
jgi:hypothetical protein